ncbi:MAG: acryloyl-CoA reductase [Gammaproteobacteria bacterium]|nr:acryloyl-CoA reductase [Gammaproteobacteria bacterium]
MPSPKQKLPVVEMQKPFNAYRIHQHSGEIKAGFEKLHFDDLSEGNVIIKAKYSDVNYKDALAATGAGKILRRFPLIGGIDVSGQVYDSGDRRFQKGDKVVVTGSGLGETVDGGYSEFVRVDGNAVIPIPEGLNEKQAMQLGTAGFTAALAIHRMEHNGTKPGNGPIVVTGATGGVGSLAINMLAQRGYEVVAVTGKKESQDYLRKIGAANILLRDEVNYGKRPLEQAQWAGAIDNVGGEMLTWLTRTTTWWGNIAAIGLAGSHELHTTVMPFILRGVNLLGVNSMATPRKLRIKIWQRLATDLKPAKLNLIAPHLVEFKDLPKAFRPLLEGRQTGRTVVKIR